MEEGLHVHVHVHVTYGAGIAVCARRGTSNDGSSGGPSPHDAWPLTWMRLCTSPLFSSKQYCHVWRGGGGSRVPNSLNMPSPSRPTQARSCSAVSTSASTYTHTSICAAQQWDGKHVL
jgi:hypothetical protein